MIKLYKIKLRGSYTVEAALVFPMILFVIISLIYFAFYLHDYAKVQSIVHEAHIRGKGLERDEIDINTGIQSYDKYLDRTVFYPIDNNYKTQEIQINNYVYEKCKDKLLMAQIENINVDLGISSIKLRVNLDMNFPLKQIESFFLGSKTLVIEYEEKHHNPMDFIRAYDVAADVGKKINIINQVTSKLKEVIKAFK